MPDVPSVTVVDSAASYRRGLGAALQAAGFALAEEVAPGDVALVTLRTETDAPVIEALAATSTVVALVPGLTAPGYAHALSHGAVAALDAEDDPELIVAAVGSIVAGTVPVPVPLLRELADLEAVHGQEAALTGDEVAWLVELAGGATVVQVAGRAGYSERAMFRRLHDVYRRLGVSGRAEALVAAQRLGLLDRTR